MELRRALLSSVKFRGAVRPPVPRPVERRLPSPRRRLLLPWPWLAARFTYSGFFLFVRRNHRGRGSVDSRRMRGYFFDRYLFRRTREPRRVSLPAHHRGIGVALLQLRRAGAVIRPALYRWRPLLWISLRLHSLGAPLVALMTPRLRRLRPLVYHLTALGVARVGLWIESHWEFSLGYRPPLRFPRRSRGLPPALLALRWLRQRPPERPLRPSVSDMRLVLGALKPRAPREPGTLALRLHLHLRRPLGADTNVYEHHRLRGWGSLDRVHRDSSAALRPFEREESHVASLLTLAAGLCVQWWLAGWVHLGLWLLASIALVSAPLATATRRSSAPHRPLLHLLRQPPWKLNHANTKC